MCFQMLAPLFIQECPSWLLSADWKVSGLVGRERGNPFFFRTNCLSGRKQTGFSGGADHPVLKKKPDFFAAPRTVRKFFDLLTPFLFLSGVNFDFSGIREIYVRISEYQWTEKILIINIYRLQGLRYSENVRQQHRIKMTEQRVFINNNNTAVCVCSKCKRTKMLNILWFENTSEVVRITNRCKCGHSQTFLLERRRFHRKK